MKCNVGGIDRSIRVILGIVLLLVGLLVPMEMLWQVLVLVAAAIALVTAAVRFCPINAMLACNTCEKAEKE
ncbi:MAG TPA: YgaP-like transmembrane domain [Sideroxyarcus sp.]|nr:YgaP-like transmembrane domain [Sideroxyarcus sp.]